MKKNRKPIFPLILLLAGLFGLLINTAWAGLQQKDQPEDKGEKNSPFAKENEQCLKCHGEKFYTLTDTATGATKRANMCLDYRINRNDYYNSVHWNFSCLDCHSDEYNTFPHALKLRFADYWTCLDCHGYDEKFAQFKFEQIDEESQKSVHYTATKGDFSCWNCHNPHSYKLLSRSTENVSEVIVETNNICLNCHGNVEKFRLLSNKDLGNVIPKHDWLPNQELHFKAVRCIECHAEMNDSLRVSHDIMPADSAVRKCVQCHSSNSILMGTLYKYRAKKSRKEYGFINGAIINNNSYVIGANRSRILNVASILIFGLVLLAMAVHTIFRIVLRKKH